jgi:hypothetical protein
MYLLGINFISSQSKIFNAWQHKIPNILNFPQLHEII